ncbi:SpdA protein, partial [Streptomyces sp. PRKS01-29]|nr:SpdA protein [Streptomyces sabulosicollis]
LYKRQAVPSDPEPAADITVDRAPEPAPELPAPAPKAPAMQVPPALVEHARKIADTHQATTGAPIDTDTLRARLNVPAPMAEVIAAQLT